MSLRVTSVGGPTVLLDLAGLRLLTDPTFSPPGRYLSTSGATLTKTAGPATTPADLGPVDAVLLSHDQHPDNLDDAGRAHLPHVPLTLTTDAAAARLGAPARGLAPWQHTDLPGVRVTAVPAQHGPAGAEAVMGHVTGFVLTGPGVPTVYVSGDNASLEVVAEIARRLGPVDVAVLFAGAARSGAFDNGLLTLDSARAAEAADLLGARWVVGAHLEQWAHLKEGPEELRAAFEKAGLGDRLVVPRAGESHEIAN